MAASARAAPGVLNEIVGLQGSGGFSAWLYNANAHIFAPVAGLETSRTKIVGRLMRDGWESRSGGRHDVFKHPRYKGRIIVPRHRTLSPGVARAIAKAAGWREP
jgi:mRNA interferase HicA